MKKLLIQSIFEIIQDYQEDDLEKMSNGKIEKWIDQFDEEDREFILSEFLHLLKQGIYISKENAKIYLWEGLNYLCKISKSKNLEIFLRESLFLNLQGENKSQTNLLRMLDEILVEKMSIHLSECGALSPKFYIYLDDILATGNTYYQNIVTFLNKNDNINGLVKNEFKVLSLFFCVHNWGEVNSRYRLNLEYDKKGFLDPNLFPICCNYLVENNIKSYNQKVNLAYPIESIKNKELDSYIQSLKDANRNFDRAYRKMNTPINEIFFTNPDNRLRFERIVLLKGIDILSQTETLKPNHRPLGMTNPSNQTFGTGTLFFTWRNISNTCPIVFWWEGHNWKGLFTLKNRGN